MTTLAPKLPWTHPFAGGYPRLGGQPLPTDPDAIDYLNRVKAADGGAAVEVGVAMAVDAFVKGCKADSAGYAGDPTRTVWDALQACCIMCGARTISGALVPLVGTAPTAYSFASGDYSRTTGLKGDGATKYLDTNRAENEEPQNDISFSVYRTELQTVSGSHNISSGLYSLIHATLFRNRDNLYGTLHTDATGFKGTSRDTGASFDFRVGGVTTTAAQASIAPTTAKFLVFRRGDTNSGYSDSRIAFYHVGSAIPDLAALDTRVTQLVTGIKFHSLTGLVATDYDPDTVAYIVAAYESGGTL